jgi:zinc transporter 1
MLGVMIHVIGDAINNIGVIIAAVAIWQSKSDARFYADPAVSLFIAISILLSSIPLVKNAGHILLQSAPRGVELADVKHDLEKVNKTPLMHQARYNPCYLDTNTHTFPIEYCQILT